MLCFSFTGNSIYMTPFNISKDNNFSRKDMFFSNYLNKNLESV